MEDSLVGRKKLAWRMSLKFNFQSRKSFLSLISKTSFWPNTWESERGRKCRYWGHWEQFILHLNVTDTGIDKFRSLILAQIDFVFPTSFSALLTIDVE